MDKYISVEERIEIVTEMREKGWSVLDERYFRDNYVEITFRKSLEVDKE